MEERFQRAGGEHRVWQTLLSLLAGWFFTGDTPKVGVIAGKTALQVALDDLGHSGGRPWPREGPDLMLRGCHHFLRSWAGPLGALSCPACMLSGRVTSVSQSNRDHVNRAGTLLGQDGNVGALSLCPIDAI